MTSPLASALGWSDETLASAVDALTVDRRQQRTARTAMEPHLAVARANYDREGRRLVIAVAVATLERWMASGWPGRS